MSLPRYCLAAFAIALIPSLSLVMIVAALLGGAGFDPSSLSRHDLQATPAHLIGALIFAPLFETFLLAAGLSLLWRLKPSRPLVASISALLWGLAHGLIAPLSFFGTVWGFFVFSCAYLAWRPTSFGNGYIAAAVPHALVNLAGMMSLLAATHALR